MSFWEKGYQAAFITSFYGNPYEHTAGDTPDRINRPFFVKAARALVELMVDSAHE